MNETGQILKHNDRETLQRATGILEGLSASGELSDAVAGMIEAVVSMIDSVLNGGGIR